MGEARVVAQIKLAAGQSRRQDREREIFPQGIGLEDVFLKEAGLQGAVSRPDDPRHLG
jgi:hypothetical protein